MRKIKSQGVHHITLVGADRQTSIDFWEGVLGMPFVFEQPNLDTAEESHLYFDPGDGRLITVFTNEKRKRDPRRTPTEPGCVHHVAFTLSRATFLQAVARLDERKIKHSAVKDRGFMDSIYFEDPLGLLIELATYRFDPPQGHTHADVLLKAHKLRVERGDYAIAAIHVSDAIDELSELRLGSCRRSLRPNTSEPPFRYEQIRTQRRNAMPAFKLNIIKPSVNNMAARVFARAADLDFAEHDVYGQTRSEEFLARNPAHLTPMLECDELPKGALWESSAIMQYLCNKHGFDQFYPKNPEQRATIDSALFYLVGTLYPYVARATYPKLNFSAISRGSRAQLMPATQDKETARQAAVAAIAEPLDVFHKFYMGGNPFIGGDKPSIADIRLASTLEFLEVINYPFPAWVADYRIAMEKALGNAYAEPAADVRSYIAYVRSQKS